jgi:hypothetical protein
MTNPIVTSLFDLGLTLERNVFGQIFYFHIEEEFYFPWTSVAMFFRKPSSAGFSIHFHYHNKVI